MTQAQSAAVDLTQVFSLGALSFRNRLINGDMRIPQRVGLNFNATTGWAYGQMDRWLSYSSAPSLSGTMAAAALASFGVANRWWNKYTITTPPTDLSGANLIVPMCQCIEGVNCYDLNTSPMVLSFKFNASVAGKYSLCLLANNNGTVAQGGYVTTFDYAVANTPQIITVLIPPMPGTFLLANDNTIGIRLSIGAIATGSFSTANLNQWIAAAGAYAAVGTVNWAANAGNFVMLTDAQLEMGVIATPFERRSGGLEYALCQRYYQSLSAELGAYNLSGTQITGYYQFPVVMRAAPSATVRSVTYNNSSAYTIDTILPTGFRAFCTVTGTGTGFATGTNISFNAELS